MKNLMIMILSGAMCFFWLYEQVKDLKAASETRRAAEAEALR